MGQRARDDSTVELSLEQTVVAVALRAPYQSVVMEALADARFMVVSDVGVPSAGVVIGDAGATNVASLRARARPDAAVVVVAPVASPEIVRDSLTAGAVACLRPPLVVEELVKVVQSALDTHAAKSQVADLARKLDLETHLASIGRMSAGLSHEISTPLLVAATNLEIARTELEQLSGAVSAREEVNAIGVAFDEMHRAHERLRGVLEMMRELVGRRRATRLDRLDLQRAAEDVKTLLTNQLHDVDVELAGPPTFARADHVLLGQILQNLVINGAHAARSLPAPRVRLHTYMHEGRAIISVRDNGPGIAPELHQKIFEPFFTTRRGRGGTGLGLALCREYALQMGAEVTLWSVPGRGACFRVAFNPA
jgi:signal transduction histidine kinase